MDGEGENIVLCESSSDPIEPVDANSPEGVAQALLSYLVQAYPGFGLDLFGGWVEEGRTEEGLVGASTRAWLSGDWTLEISYPVVPEPRYEAILSHVAAGVVWSGAVEGGEVIPADEPLSLSSAVGECDETVPVDTLNEWEEITAFVRNGTVVIEQKLAYLCCAEMELSAGRDGNVVRIIETNVGSICRCMCGYPVTMELAGLPSGTYAVEIWGVQHTAIHFLELRGSVEVVIP
jgi:hypothetical protein